METIAKVIFKPYIPFDVFMYLQAADWLWIDKGIHFYFHRPLQKNIGLIHLKS